MSAGAIRGNVVTGTVVAGGGGGGVFVGGSFDMSGTAQIAGNESSISPSGVEVIQGGGGVFVGNGGTFTMQNTGHPHIHGNSAISGGGGVHVATGGNFHLQGGTIGALTGVTPAEILAQRNTATGNGGGVFASGAGEFIMGQGGGNPAISHNSANGHGGGVNLSGTRSFTMHGGEIRGGTGSLGGGVIMLGTSTFTMNNGHIHGNAANAGGGVSMLNNANFTMQGGTIGALAGLTGPAAEAQANTASTTGGGINLQGTGSTANVTIGAGAAVRGNSSAWQGGGIYVHSRPVTINGTIQNNTSFSSGGGVAVVNEHVNVGSGASFTGNRTTGPNGTGGAIFMSGTTEAAANTIVQNLNNNWVQAVANRPVFASNSANERRVNNELRNTANHVRPFGGLTSIAPLNDTVSPHVNANLFNNYDIYVQGAAGWSAMNFDWWLRLQVANVPANGTAVINIHDATTVAEIPVTDRQLLAAGGAVDIGGGRNITLWSSTAPDAGGTITLATGNTNRHFSVDGATLTMGNPASLNNNLVLRGHNPAGGGTVTGGGVNVGAGGIFNMQGGEIARNHSANGGGGVRVEGNGTFNMSGGAVHHNNASGGTIFTSTWAGPQHTAGGGGVLAIAGGHIVMSGTAQVHNNTAAVNTWGGGVAAIGVGTFTMNGDAQIHNNTASHTGPYMTGPQGVGAGVGINGRTLTMDGNARINNNTLANTTAGNLAGGAIATTATLNMRGNSRIDSNTAYAVGGVLITEGSTLNMEDNARIHHNTATTSAVGGVHLGGNAPVNALNMSGNAQIHNNIAQTVAGGVNVVGFGPANAVSIQGPNVQIRDNHAGTYGGGIHFQDTAAQTLARLQTANDNWVTTASQRPIFSGNTAGNGVLVSTTLFNNATLQNIRSRDGETSVTAVDPNLFNNYDIYAQNQGFVSGHIVSFVNPANTTQNTTRTVQHGQTVGAGNMPTVTNPDPEYVFVRWESAPNVTFTATTPVNGPMTVTAIWVHQDDRWSGTFPALDFGVRQLSAQLQIHRLGDGTVANNFYGATPIASANITVSNPHALANWQLQVSFANDTLGNMMRVGPTGGSGVTGVVYTNSTNSTAASHTISWVDLRAVNRDVLVAAPPSTPGGPGTPGGPSGTLSTNLTWTFIPQ